VACFSLSGTPEDRGLLIHLERFTLWPFFSVLLFLVLGCGSPDQSKGLEPLELTLAVQYGPHSGLIAIARERGFFEEFGLDLTIEEYHTGKKCLEALLRGDADLATSADIAFTAKILEGASSLRIVGSLGLTAGSTIVARKDKGIRQPSDLKGKTIAYTSNTTSEYFLDVFLLLIGIPTAEVNTMDIPQAEIIDALEAGEVDAASVIARNAYGAVERMGENIAVWNAQGPIEYHWLLVVEEELIPAPGEPVKRLLQALIKAEEYYLANRDSAMHIVMDSFGIDPEYMELKWDSVVLNLSLNQSMINSLETIARWKLKKQGAAGLIPHFTDYIHVGTLEEVEPDAVRIFR
jgi:ABC-type nitrate/sulfonate/bicarbonate transport system substrate-binding protein